MTADVIDLAQRREPFNPGNGALELIQRYLTDVYPARCHGKTDCGELLDGTANLPDGDHFLIWLAAEGYAIVPLEDVL